MRVIVAGLPLGALAAEVLIVGPEIGRAARSLSRPNLWCLLVALLAQVVSLSAFARLRRRMLFAGGTRVPVRRILVLTYAANAISLTLPAGAALSTAYTFRRLRRWGNSIPLASFTLIASGVLSSLAFALLGLSGALVVGADRRSPYVLTAAIISAIGAVLLVRRLSDRPNLVASCRAVGAQKATIALVLITYLAGMSMSSMSLLPGGLGVVETTMILALTHGGLTLTSATAAVLLYRLISFVLIAATGWVLWLATWRSEHPRDRLARGVSLAGVL